MRLFPRRPRETSKEEALAEAREATARFRREKTKGDRYRAKKQPDPATQMTTNQWIAGGD